MKKRYKTEEVEPINQTTVRKVQGLFADLPEAANEEAPKPPRVIKINEFLEYKFSEQEIRDFAQQLAADIRRIEELREQKTSAASQFKASIDEVQARANCAAEHIRTGGEFRNLACEVHFDPERGVKTLYRLDTGEEVWTKELEEYEYQAVLPLDDSDVEAPDPETDQDPTQTMAEAEAEAEAEKPAPDPEIGQRAPDPGDEVPQ